jgi:pectin methylesterase-like acyl-CoA thioesterase
MKTRIQLVLVALLLCAYSSILMAAVAITNPPVVTSPIAVGATSVSGTSTEADNTVITVYVNYVNVGTALVSTNTWTLSSLTPLTVGQLVEATALADLKTVSDTSNVVTVQAVSAVPVVTSPVLAGATSVSGTSTEADGTTIEVFVNSVSAGTTTVTGGAWTLSAMTMLTPGQVVTAKATASGKIISSSSTSVTVITNYRSVVTGNWGSAATWEQWNGTAWISATSAPTVTSGNTITIQSDDTVTVASAVVISSGCNVVVNGYLKSTAGITGPTSVPLSFTFNNGSSYEHAMIAGSIPMATWNTGSTCLITGTTSGSPGNGIQNFYNFTWNCPGQTTGLNLAWDNITIGGNLTVTASGTGASQQFRMSSAATTRTITINGDVIVNGGYLTASGSSGAAQYNVTVKGNINIQSGKFNLCGGSGGYGTWRLWGNLTIGAAGQFVVGSNKTINTILLFAGGGAQSYTLTAGGTNANLSYGVENGSTVTLNSPLTVGNTTAGNGGLVLTSGKFITTATNLMTLASAASITTGTGYVSGPLAETVAATTSTPLTFPIGKSAYRPAVLTLTQDATTSTVYTAEIFDSTPTSRTLPPALDGVSTTRYLHIVKGSGANVTNASINLTYDATDGLDVSNKDNIRIAKDDGAGTWISLGGSGSANTSGNISSGNAFGQGTAYGALTTNDFVLAHADPTFVPSVATITTNAVTDISTTFATSGGTFSSDGGAAITAKGVCWNTGGSPTTSDSKTSDGVTSNPFTSSITGLTLGTIYHIRAYATNSAGTAYGNELSFTTLSALAVPTLTTDSIKNIVYKTATGYGTVIAWGGSTVTDRGMCWSTSHNPTIADDYNSNGTGSGVFNAPIGGLTLSATYYVRAYATNSTGTGYGDEISFNTPVAQADVYKIVDKAGAVGVNCDYTTVQAAFDAVTPNYTGRWIIYVKNGTYYEKTWLISTKMNVVLVGESEENTILTFDDYAGNGRTTVCGAAGSVTSSGTNLSFTCAIDAPDFEAQNITFQNTANAYAPSSTATQAVALRTNGDRQEYYNCKMLGYQDTYYTQGGITGPDRIYNNNCYVEGAVDFIFGRDVALFDSCTIFCNRTGGVLTAAATEAGYTYGYVFKACSLLSTAAGVKGCDSTAMVSFYLGRPWQASPKTVYLDCYEQGTVNAAGWTTMGPNPSLYAENNCSGPGYIAGRPGLSAWGGTQPTTITAGQAATYTIANIFSKTNKGSGFTYAANWTPSKENIDYGLLPVELASFTAASKGLIAQLHWSTATESNNYGFEIERRVAGNAANWQKVGFVAGAGTSANPHEYRYEDKNITAGRFMYRLKQIDNNGLFKYSASVEIELGNNVPRVLALGQNYPNPFNPTTTIEFTLAEDSKVSLKVFDILGREVKMLVNENLKADIVHQVPFNASALSSGLYFYRLDAGNKSLVKKLMLLK